ncbi:indole-3-glycerol phosphate synthase [Streptomyces sp. NPDC005962]|uniref:indole-3-glycerol phosphate synthase n=1 Tax=Streptomyces sp. NPDC005962 TaxID=3154466 RepID=UPI0033E5DBFE
MFTSILMIEKPLTAADVEFVTTLHGDDPVSFVVMMQPRGSKDRLLRAIDDIALGELEQATQEGEEPEGSEALEPAERALNHSVAALRAAGSEARGHVVQRRPLDILRGVVEETGADEVIVLTAPHFVEEFFHRDWASRARHKVGVPVLKLFAHTDGDDEVDEGYEGRTTTGG